MTRVVSIRLAKTLDETARASADRAGIAFADALDFLLRCSFHADPGLDGLEDASDQLNSRIHIRLPEQTLERLKVECARLGIQTSVYVRLLLYHFYITGKAWLVKEGDYYKLAVINE